MWERESLEVYIFTLPSMGDEKWAEALESIDRALKGDPENAEYTETKSIIMKQINK